MVFSEIIEGNNVKNKPKDPSVVDQTTGVSVGLKGSDYPGYQNCLSAGTYASMWDYKGEYWTSQDAGRGGTFSVTVLHNSKSCYMNNAWDSLDCASSYHSAGVNPLFLGGSVKFIKSTINYVTWYGIAAINSSEVISADSY